MTYSISPKRYRASLALISTLITLFANAQSDDGIQLLGTIRDTYLNNGIKGVTLTLMRQDSTVVEGTGSYFMEVGKDDKSFTAMFYLFAQNTPGDYLVRAQKEGYDDGWAKVTIPNKYDKRQGPVRIPEIQMRRSIKTIALNGVEVKATRVKVFTRGDTLVYDASAFNMPDGSMLGNLIAQLPGARINDMGEIFINNRKIDELTLNSKTLFRGNQQVLMENLPYFTVKELKVFERESMAALLSGNKELPKEYVMDVRLKNEYSTGLIANSDLGLGTHDRYAGRVFGILLTKTVNMGIFANLNNVNDRSKAVGQAWHTETNGWRLGGDKLPSRRAGAGFTLNYQSEKTGRFGLPLLSVYNENFLDGFRYWDDSEVYRERFLPGGTAFARSMANHTERNRAWYGDLQGCYCPLWGYIQYNIHYSYKEDRTSDLTTMSQWDERGETASQRTEGLYTRRIYSFSIPQLRFSIFHRDAELYAGWNRTTFNGFDRQQSAYTALGTTDFRHDKNELTKTGYYFTPSIPIHEWKLFGNLRLGLHERYSLTGEHSDNRIFQLSNLDGWGIADGAALDLLPSTRDALMRAYDPVNSSYSDFISHENTLTPSLKLAKTDHRPFDITLSFPFVVRHERLDYQRDLIDTLANRTMIVVNPSLSLRHKLWRGSLGFTSSTPGMMNLMPYRDARNPLNITEGNPDLRNNQQIAASFNWSRTSKETKASLRASTDYTHHLRSVAHGFTYDPATSAYTFRPENVSGNWSWRNAFSTSHPFDHDQRFWLDTETRADAQHSVDFASVSPSPTSYDQSPSLEGRAGERLNKVETVTLSEALKARYMAGQTKLTLLADVKWRRTWGHREAQPGISAFDYRYGLIAQHTFAPLNTTFNLDACMYSRRGYTTDAMNRDEFIVNVSASRPVLKGKVVLKLETFDLLRRLSSTQYEVNAQGRTETWHRTLPDYVMLHATWHFNINPSRQ